MKLTAGQVYDATLCLSQIIRENRPMSQKGKYRLARLHAKLMTEFTPISEQRDAIIKAYGFKNDLGQDAVPVEHADDWLAQWKELADQEIEVDVQPIPFEQIDNEAGSIAAAEFIVLGPLVADPE